MKHGASGDRKGLVVLMLLVLGVVTASAVAHVWTHLEVIDHGYRISKASRQRDGLKERNRRLRIELAVLKDPARVARLAAGRMGFGPPEPEQIRRLRKPSKKGSGITVAVGSVSGGAWPRGAKETSRHPTRH